MYAKYLAEIRARCDAATPGPWKPIEKGNTVPSHAVFVPSIDGSVPVNICSGISPKTGNAAFISHSRADIPALLAEVERQDRQIATLKRALELMSRTACGEMPGTMPEWDMVGCVPDKSCMKENPCKGSDNECHECWTRYFIHQAQEQEAGK